MFNPKNYTNDGLKVHINKRVNQIAELKKELGSIKPIPKQRSHQQRWKSICNSVRELQAN